MNNENMFLKQQRELLQLVPINKHMWWRDRGEID